MKTYLISWYVVGIISYIGCCAYIGRVTVGNLAQSLVIGCIGLLNTIMLVVMFVQSNNVFNIIIWERKRND